MKSLHKLQGLIDLHQRAAGHTTAMLNIAYTSRATIVVANRQQKHLPVFQEAHHHGLHIITLDDVMHGPFSLRGPIVVDHYTLNHLCHELRDDMEATFNELRAARTEIAQLKLKGKKCPKKTKSRSARA